MPNIIFAYLITKVAAKKIEATSKIVRENLTTSPCPHDMSLDDIKKRLDGYMWLEAKYRNTGAVGKFRFKQIPFCFNANLKFNPS